MRSILALGLAVLVLAAEAPGIFIESPVCAAVDGVGAVARKPVPASCCGSGTCPMKASSCGMGTSCPMGSEGTVDQAVGAPDGSSQAKLCAPSCGREGARVIPGLPDPGTMAPDYQTATILAAANAPIASDDLPTRNPVPAEPPPRL